MNAIIDWLSEKYDTVTLVIVFLTATVYISGFISQNYKLYNQIREDSSMSKVIMYADDIKQINLSINTSDEVILFNKPALIEVKVEEKKENTRQLKLTCSEQIVN